MLRSNLLSLNLKFMMTAAVLSSLVACTLPKSDSNADGKKSSATYFVDSADASATLQIMDQKISIPIAQTFSFKACVKDIRKSQPIINHHFSIKTESGDIDKMTDASGCLVWSEEIKYNHLAPAYYIELVRTIHADGYQKGDRDLHFAINPWEHKAESLLEKKMDFLVPYKKMSNALAGIKDDSSAEVSRPVWVDDLRLTVYEKQISNQGMVLDFMIRASPSLVLISSAGDRILQPLTYGEFDTEISLIHVVSENQKEVRRLLTAPIQARSKMSEGYLNIEAPITLDKICTRGQIEVALKLTPKNAPKSLLPFEGVYVGGDCDSVKGSSFNRLTNVFQEAKGSMTIQQYLTDKSVPSASTSVTDSTTADQDYYQPGKINVLPLVINSLGFSDQHTVMRTRLFKVTACMSGPLDMKALRSQNFVVTKVNGSVDDKVQTNTQGCLFWEDSYSYNFLENESWREVSVHIANKNLALDQKLIFHINPWGNNDVTSFQDPRNFGSQGHPLTAAKGKSQIILNTYAYDKLSFDYVMNPQMNLTMKKNVLFKLMPRMKRPSLTDPSGFAEEALPVGPYALRWAVVDMSVNDLTQAKGKVYQVDERLVILNGNSTVAETLALQTADLRDIANTNKILVELFPLKENAAELKRQNPALTLDQLADDKIQMSHSLYAGALILSNNNDGTTLVPFKESSTSLLPALKLQLQADQAVKAASALRFARKEVFASDNTLVTVNLYDQKQSQNLRANLSYAHRYAYYPAQHSSHKDDLIPYPQEKMEQWLKTGVMDQDLVNRFCDFISLEILRSPRNQKNVFSVKSASNLDQACRDSSPEALSQALLVQYRYFLKNPTLVATNSPEMRDVSIATGFSMNKGVTDSLTTSLSLSIGLGAKGVIPSIPFVGASVGGNYSISRSHSQNNGYGANQTFSTGVSLTLEKITATVRADSFEKCAMIKLGSIYFASDMMEYAEPGTSREDLNRTLAKGLLICSKPSGPATIDENYYVLNQRMPYSTIVDPASSQSRPFFTVLRGDNDLNRMMTYLEGAYETPETGTATDVNKEMIQKKMRNIFEIVIPTYPGQIVREH